MPESAAEFDPYQDWLGIPPQAQPPNHYRLLGLQPFEADEEVIEAAASRLIAFCEQNTQGPHAADARRIVVEIAAARLCLLDRNTRQAYDTQLRSRAAAKSAAKTPVGRIGKQAARPQATGVRRPVPPPAPRQANSPERPSPRQSAPERPAPVAPAKGSQSAARPATTPRPVPPPLSPPTVVPFPTITDPTLPNDVAPVLQSPLGLEGTPPVPEPASELADPFVSLANDTAAAPSPKKRTAGRAGAINSEASKEGDAGETRRSGRKKKRSQSLIVVGGLAAITLLMLIVAAVLLLGGGDTSQVATKSESAEAADDDQEEVPGDAFDSEPSVDEVKTPQAMVSSANPTPTIAPAITPSVTTPEGEKAANTDDGKNTGSQNGNSEGSDEVEAAPVQSAKAATERLQELCAHGGSDMEIKKLLAAGAKLESTDLNGRTPLRLAVVGRHFLLAKALIAAKANVNATDSRGETALMSAAQSGDEKLLNLLLAAKANPSLATVGKGDRPAGTTALHVAARHGNTTAVQLLLEHGARLDQGNEQGVTPLMVAAWQGHADAALVLLDKGADVKNTFDAAGQTPLMYAAHGGNLAIVNAILARGAQANHETPTHATALSIALGSPEVNEAVVERLREAAAQEAPVLDF